jgi:hypothetical protein
MEDDLDLPSAEEPIDYTTISIIPSERPFVMSKRLNKRQQREQEELAELNRVRVDAEAVGQAEVDEEVEQAGEDVALDNEVSDGDGGEDSKPAKTGKVLNPFDLVSGLLSELWFGLILSILIRLHVSFSIVSIVSVLRSPLHRYCAVAAKRRPR